MSVKLGDLAKALHWKYGEGIMLEEDGGIVKVKKWSNPSLPQPPESEFPSIILEYEADQKDKKDKRKKDKKDLLTKLGLNSNDIPALVALIEDGNDE